jgi:catalase (peroxidase I)
MDIETGSKEEYLDNAEEMMLNRTQLLGLTAPEMTCSCWWNEGFRY